MVSVTKLIDYLNKPALLFWSNSIGLEGKSLNEYREESAKKGTKKHLEVENYIKNGVRFKGVDSFIKNIENNYNIIGVEVKCDNGYINGRIDLLLEKDGKTYVCDLKSNKKIYLNTKLQLSAYKEIYKADYVCHITLNDFDLKVLNIDTVKYFDIIRNLYRIHNKIKELNEKL